MFFEEKPLFKVTLDARRGETLDLLLTALAMASYELAPSLEDQPSSGFRRDAMLSPDEAMSLVKGDELVMLYVKGKLCFTHVRQVRRHCTQADVSGRIGIEVTSYDGDVQKLFDRADRILDWLAPGEQTQEAVVPERDDAPFPVDVDFDIPVIVEFDLAVA